tara:strand:- start:441 stop:749 length:309 start_codon:yes stop_codon:yes gene_type:complete
LSNFISKSLCCFQIKTGKFAGVIFFFKDVYAKKLNNTNDYEVSFSYEIVGGNYRDRGYKSDEEHLNRKVNLNTKDVFIKEIGIILNPLLSNNDSRVFVQWGD